MTTKQKVAIIVSEMERFGYLSLIRTDSTKSGAFVFFKTEDDSFYDCTLEQAVHLTRALHSAFWITRREFDGVEQNVLTFSVSDDKIFKSNK